jgi:hypothetical protein
MSIKTQPTTEGPYSRPEDNKAEITEEGSLQTSLTDSLSKNPVIYRSGEIAEAEPALPGWTLPVDDLLTNDKVLGEEAEPAYSEDGVDLTLIRWMLSMTPAERLETLQQWIEPIMELRYSKLNI